MKIVAPRIGRTDGLLNCIYTCMTMDHGLWSKSKSCNRFLDIMIIFFTQKLDFLIHLTFQLQKEIFTPQRKKTKKVCSHSLYYIYL